MKNPYADPSRRVAGPGHGDRLAKKLTAKGWVDVVFETLRVGDICLLFEKDGTPIPGSDGVHRRVVMLNPEAYTNELGVETFKLATRAATAEDLPDPLDPAAYFTCDKCGGYGWYWGKECPGTDEIPCPDCNQSCSCGEYKPRNWPNCNGPAHKQLELRGT